MHICVTWLQWVKVLYCHRPCAKPLLVNITAHGYACETRYARWPTLTRRCLLRIRSGILYIFEKRRESHYNIWHTFWHVVISPLTSENKRILHLARWNLVKICQSARGLCVKLCLFHLNKNLEGWICCHAVTPLVTSSTWKYFSRIICEWFFHIWFQIEAIYWNYQNSASLKLTEFWGPLEYVI